MELFACDLFDDLVVRFELLDSLGVLAILFLQAIHLIPQALHFCAFLAVNNNPVVSERGVQEYSDNKQGGGGGANSPPFSAQPQPHRTRTLNPARGQGFGAWSLFRDRAESALGIRQDPRSRQ